MKMHICKDIDLDDYSDFDDFVSDVLGDNSYVGINESDTHCYLHYLQETEDVPENLIPAVLEMGLRDITRHGATARMLLVSVTSRESNHKGWLEAVEGYPGATVTKLERDEPARTVYTILIPSIPAL